MNRVKKIVRYLLFFGILAVIFLGLSRVFYPKDNSVEAGMPPRDVKVNGIFGAENNSLDVIFFGDSITFTSIKPVQIWEEQGIASYVCGQSGQIIPEAYNWLKQILEKQSPDIVVLETNLIYMDGSMADQLNHALELQLASDLPFYKYHNRWKNMDESDWSRQPEEPKPDFTMGYEKKTAIVPYTGGDYMQTESAKEPLAFVPESYLDAVHRFCEKNNIQMMLVSIPSPQSWNGSRHDAVTEYAQEHDVLYLDLNLYAEELGIDWKSDTLDGGDHLNEAGATKVSKYLGTFLKERYGLTDHRGNAAYTVWDRLVEDQ